MKILCSRFLIFVLLALLPFILSAQGKQANTWYFGHNAGLSFAAGDPVALTDGMINTKEGCATISTPQGALQFYTDGITVFDRYHDTMPNGRGLMGHPSSTQSALIVPVPGSITNYYIFTTDAGEHDLQNGLRYSMVDMTLNNYKGDVISNEKNILLAYPACEKVTATLHRDGESYWVITKMFDNSEFRAYRITTSGLQPDVVISNTGPPIAGYDNYAGMGALKISPDGKWLAMATIQTKEVGFYKFDDYTGTVTYVGRENVSPIFPYGVEFSPNSKLVYVSDRYETRIIQYDLSIEDSTSIINSRIELTLFNSTADSTTALQLGPDNRIYVSRNSYNYISRINNPNMRGDACGYQQQAVNLNGKYCVEGLPPFIQSFFFPLQVKVEQHCSNGPTQFTLENPEGIDSLRWDFNDDQNAPYDTSTLFNPVYQFSHADTFYVRLTAWAEIGPRTILDTVIIYERPTPDLGPDRIFCNSDPIDFNLYAGPIGIYYWNDSPFAGLNILHVTSTGEYRVMVNNHGCIGRDTMLVSNADPPSIQLIAESEHDGNGDGRITVISTGVNLTYMLEGGVPQTGNVFTGLSSGKYYVIATDEFGCATRDSIFVGNNTGTLLEALADDDRKCLYKPADSDIRITRASGMKEMQATLYFNSNILNCTNFNANSATFPGITAHLFTLPARIELDWNGQVPIPVDDTLLMGTMIFETIDYGVANVIWDTIGTVTYFRDEYGSTIQSALETGIITVYDLPEATAVQPPPLCENDSITLIGQVTGGADPLQYHWTTPHGNSTGQQLQVLNAGMDDAGNYQFTVSDNFHCSNTAVVNLRVVPLPGANFPATNLTHDTILFEQSFLLEATPGYASYEWNTGDTTYYINVTEEGEYSVTIKTTEGCKSVESVFLHETFVPIDVPNAFTPNGDGMNDTFKPVMRIEPAGQFSMSIYNKWGQRIFETTNATQGWDGMDAMPGVYNWIISYSNLIEKVYQLKGIVTLIMSVTEIR